MQSYSIKLSAGSYYVGDPFFVLSSEDYDRLPGSFGLQLFPTGDTIVYAATDGNGERYDSNGAVYHVTSGMLAVVPDGLFDCKMSKQAKENNWGSFRLFTGPVEVTVNCSTDLMRISCPAMHINIEIMTTAENTTE